jgi:membrane associated rhomboid family serine protease
MLFIPLEKNIDWKKPPVITITLIIINVICYFGFQMNDKENYSEAMRYYFKSGLYEIEVPYYAKYLENKNNIFTLFVTKKETTLSKAEMETLFFKMRNDGAFLAELENNQIIKKEDENYRRWKSLSDKYKTKLNRATFYAYGLKSYKSTFETLFSHMFLHANFEHLFWNMVFLFVFGFSVEMILGWKIYLPTYLLAGIGSGLFYTFLEPNSAIPGIGASGAISGLAGLYTVLFGLRKIRFFYFIFVFFDTVKAPALVILPLWLGYELYNHYFIPTNINNLAHAGGLVSGALIAYVAKKFHKNINNEYMNENNVKEIFDKRHAEALSAIAAFNMEKAKTILLELDHDYPGNIEVLKQLFNVFKLAPNSDGFHQYARAIFLLPEENSPLNKEILEVYKEYVSKAQPKPKLNADIMIKLAFRFLKANMLEEVEKIILLLIKNKIKHKDLSVSLQMLINKYRETNVEKSNKYQHIYNTLF